MFACYCSPDPEAPQEEVVVTPEPQAEPEVELEPEPAVVELKQEPVSQAESHPLEKAQRAPPSPTPADPAPAAPEDNRVSLHLVQFGHCCGSYLHKDLRELKHVDFVLMG